MIDRNLHVDERQVGSRDRSVANPLQLQYVSDQQSPDEAIATQLAKKFDTSHNLTEIGRAIRGREQAGGDTGRLLSALRDALSQYDYSLTTEGANGKTTRLEVDKFNRSKQQWEPVTAISL
jgi:hypothetical protein